MRQSAKGEYCRVIPPYGCIWMPWRGCTFRRSPQNRPNWRITPCLEKKVSHSLDASTRRSVGRLPKGCKAGGSKPISSLLEKHCFSNRITRTLLGGYQTSGCLSSGVTTLQIFGVVSTVMERLKCQGSSVTEAVSGAGKENLPDRA